MSRRRRRRHKSFEIEMSYEALQLQTLQFCVMGYDEYSRNKVIGDVLLPLAELARQGLDITRELVMWRDIQTCQPVNNSSFLYRECFFFSLLNFLVGSGDVVFIFVKLHHESFLGHESLTKLATKPGHK